MSVSDLGEEGWRQIRAGVSLIEWSKLAELDRRTLTLKSTDESTFESSLGHAAVHAEYGRLICWITFGVGSEYVAKGVCILVAHLTGKPKAVIRQPLEGEPLETWANAVNSRVPSSEESTEHFGTLGGLPVMEALGDHPTRGVAQAGIRFLASTVRNRDAHRYVQSVRAGQFPAMQAIVIPALNALLSRVNQDQLRAHLAKIQTLGMSNREDR